jgi:hypothetical protein
VWSSIRSDSSALLPAGIFFDLSNGVLHYKLSIERLRLILFIAGAEYTTSTKANLLDEGIDRYFGMGGKMRVKKFGESLCICGLLLPVSGRLVLQSAANRHQRRSQVISRVELADYLPTVTGDRVQLQQVVLNLLLNAADAMRGIDDRPRQLIVRTERDEGDQVRLSVQDAGVGFGPQGVDKLFEPFYTSKNGGMGIGLAVSRSIIENHHGRLWAIPNDGPGATFSFSIPRGRQTNTKAQ